MQDRTKARCLKKDLPCLSRLCVVRKVDNLPHKKVAYQFQSRLYKTDLWNSTNIRSEDKRFVIFKMITWFFRGISHELHFKSV
jgi:hypothetical protein